TPGSRQREASEASDVYKRLIYSSTSMSTLGFIDINKAPFKVFIFSMSTLKGAFQMFLSPISLYLLF
ncbi:hypothetical protein C7R37_09500, partial [Staphylococcus aureus]